jgi:hypothetical protein
MGFCLREIAAFDKAIQVVFARREKDRRKLFELPHVVIVDIWPLAFRESYRRKLRVPHVGKGTMERYPPDLPSFRRAILCLITPPP